ncbi:hypothetical protein ACIVBQ_001807 [Tenacibaculum discolor]
MKNYVLPLMASAILCLVSCSQDKTEEVLEEKTVKTAKPQNLLMYKELVPMLEHYDKTRKPVLEKALGYEDTRMNYYSIETIENYLTYVKKIAKEKGIKLTGINFVSAAYHEGFHGKENYQTMVFMPTTEINGKNVCFDPVQSTTDKLVTVKEMLANYGYKWVYDSKEDYENRHESDKELQQKKVHRNSITDSESGAGNLGTYSPPYR